MRIYIHRRSSEKEPERQMQVAIASFGSQEGKRERESRSEKKGCRGTKREEGKKERERERERWLGWMCGDLVSNHGTSFSLSQYLSLPPGLSFPLLHFLLSVSFLLLWCASRTVSISLSLSL